MFSYCNNNPVCYVDTNGESIALALSFAAELIAKVIFDASVSFVFAKLAYDVATGISDLIKPSSETKSPPKAPEPKSKESDGEVTTANPPTENDGYVAPKKGPPKKAW